MRGLLLGAALLLSLQTAAAAAQPIPAFSGAPLPFFNLAAVRPDCRPIPGQFVVAIVRKPEHGRLSWSKAFVTLTFPRSNPEHVCNGAARPGIRFYYTASPGYVGPDDFGIQVTGPLGRTFTEVRRVSVQAGRV